jgi:hypothetical protein
MSEPEIVIAIPHYFGIQAPGTKRHAANSTDRTERALAVRRTVLGLHHCFGVPQCQIQIEKRATIAANQSIRRKLKILVCTRANDHLLADAQLPEWSYEQVVVNAAAAELGYVCREAMASYESSAEWLGYLEDDLLIHDSLWFQKLSWFQQLAGRAAVLLPNRYELGESALAVKAYVDGDIREQASDPFQNRAESSEMRTDFLGSSLRFVRPKNPHAGCYFLHREQWKRWKEHPSFSERSRAFIGPLESAASLGIMQTFRVYKPAPEHAAFFEVEHQSRQFIRMLRGKP